MITYDTMLDLYGKTYADRVAAREARKQKFKYNPFYDGYEVRGWVKALGVVLVIAAVIFGAVFGICKAVNTSNTNTCRAEAKAMGYDWRFNGWSSQECFLKIDGKYVPDSAYVLNKGN